MIYRTINVTLLWTISLRVQGTISLRVHKRLSAIGSDNRLIFGHENKLHVIHSFSLMHIQRCEWSVNIKWWMVVYICIRPEGCPRWRYSLPTQRRWLIHVLNRRSWEWKFNTQIDILIFRYNQMYYMYKCIWKMESIL